MQNIKLSSSSPIRPSTSASDHARTDALPKRPKPFTRPVAADSGRASELAHRMANGTRRLFGRHEQPSAEQQQAVRQMGQRFTDYHAPEVVASASAQRDEPTPAPAHQQNGSRPV